MLTILRQLPDDAAHRPVNSPLGTLHLIANARALVALLWERDYRRHAAIGALARGPHPILDAAQAQLTEYFVGHRRRFDLPIELVGTPFQRRAWATLQTIPYGETISYGAQAKAMGDARKARAVGGANGKNPISIIVPCHRVIGADGGLTGFGGGLEQKARLLKLESTT